MLFIQVLGIVIFGSLVGEVLSFGEFLNSSLDQSSSFCANFY